MVKNLFGKDNPDNQDSKQEQLDQYRVKNAGHPVTTNQGKKLANDDEQLKAGERGPVLMQDYEYFEKMTRFVHEETPERVVHARGYSAYGEFETYESMKDVTKAGFLQEAGKKTPLFVRFSTVQGSKGSKDTAQDLRCLGVKFYTEEGNYDLTSIAMPVLINQDAMKFPDAMRAYQSKQDDGIPTATGAHDNLWDYVANNEEATHMVMWIMSDRGLLKNYRHMESWAINTYLFVNEEGKATFVRFVWKPVLGVKSLLMDEAMFIGGIDPDYHRKDLREAIDKGAYPEYELGVQLIDMEDEFKFDFDILDPSKYWPEEEIPVKIIGKMTLNRNIDNEHAESEQSAFNPANVVPGIDFSNDPVLQGRLIAYQSAQYHRIGPNCQGLPVNRPVCPFHNNHRRGTMRYRIDTDKVNYNNNSLAENSPHTTPVEEGGYESYPKHVEGRAVRGLSDSFNDHYTQPRIFWNSMTDVERKHLIDAYSFHLGKVMSESVRQQNVELLARIDEELGNTVADNIGVDRPVSKQVDVSTRFPSLSQMTKEPFSAFTQKVGILVGNAFDDKEVMNVKEALEEAGAFVEIISEKLGMVKGKKGTELKVNHTFLTMSPHLLDSIYIAGGTSMDQKKFDMHLMEFAMSAYKHFKPIGVSEAAEPALMKSDDMNMEGVVFAKDSKKFDTEFVSAVAQQRFWNRV